MPIDLLSKKKSGQNNAYKSGLKASYYHIKDELSFLMTIK